MRQSTADNLGIGCGCLIVGGIFLAVIAFEIAWRWLLIDAGLKLLGHL